MDLTRGLTPNQLNYLKRSTFFPNLLVQIDWKDDPLRFHMLGTQPITFQGNQYRGFGPMAEINLPRENQTLDASPGSLSIAGVSHDLEGMIDSPIRGNAVSIWMAFMSESGNNALVGPPINIFRGVIGSGKLITTDDGEITYNRAIIDLNIGPSARAASTIYHSNEDQTSKHPNDTAGRLTILAFARAQKLRWPE